MTRRAPCHVRDVTVVEAGAGWIYIIPQPDDKIACGRWLKYVLREAVRREVAHGDGHAPRKGKV